MRSPMRVPAVVRENTYLKIRTLAQRLLSRLAPERLAWAEMKLMGIKRLPRWPALSRSSGGGAVCAGRRGLADDGGRAGGGRWGIRLGGGGNGGGDGGDLSPAG